MKIIDAESYLSALCELTEEGNAVSTVVTGGSMLPFLSSNRDFVILEKPDRPLRKGDVVLFKRSSGDFVLHRIRYIHGCEFFLIGDSQTATEGPIKAEQILALATGVKRKGKLLTPKSFTWKFFEKVWPHLIFLRPVIFKIVHIIHRNRKQKSK